jgi:predicted O-methyltransferase YrrM
MARDSILGLMSRVSVPITPELVTYIRKATLSEPDVLRRLRESSASHPLAHLHISPEQGQFLHVMARLVGAKKTLEVGIFMGYSSTWVALALPAGGKLVACDISEEYAAIARRTWREAGVEDRVELRLGPALESLDALLAEGQAGTFDLVFIDADKSNYLNYYERALALVREGGLVIADNVLWHGQVADPADHDDDTEMIRAFNRKLRDDSRVANTIAMTSTGDGFGLACKL